MSKILLASDTINRDDVNALTKWMNQDPIPQLTKSKLTIEYEKKYAQMAGRKYCVFVNSGSSANLIAMDALKQTKRLKNNLVVVPTLGWITTISPVIQHGMQPILCDINLKDLSVCTQHLERLFIQHRPACLVLVSILGLVPDMEEIQNLCNKYEVLLVMDNCESQGSRFGERDIQSFGLMSTCSSYFGHISSTVEGGTVCTDDEELYHTLLMLRSHGWDRDLPAELQEAIRKKWDITNFNARYTFYHTGYNVRNDEMGAFLGLRQLTRLDEMIKRRNHNYNLYNQLIKNEYWKPCQPEHHYVSNLGYPIIHPNRDKIVQALEDAGVELRPLVSGSMGIQPFFVNYNGSPAVLPNVVITNNYGFYVPNHQNLTDADVRRVSDIVNCNMEG